VRIEGNYELKDYIIIFAILAAAVILGGWLGAAIMRLLT
jgi:hypothetical protein